MRAASLGNRALALLAPLTAIACLSAFYVAGCDGGGSSNESAGDDAAVDETSADADDATVDSSPDVRGDSAVDSGRDARDAESGADARVDADTSGPDVTADVADAPDVADTSDAVEIGDGSAAVPSLGAAATFSVLGGVTVTSTGLTVVNGDLGVWPGLAVTGFPPGVVVGGTIDKGGATSAAGQASLTTAYDALKGAACGTDLTSTDLSGLTLGPGVYCFSSSAAISISGTLTLDAKGDPGAFWIFQVGSTLTTPDGAAVVVIGGGSACNVFWQVGSSATLGKDNRFGGNIVAFSSITVQTGSAVSGRALARNGAVTLDTNAVAFTTCGGATAGDSGVDAGVGDAGDAADGG